MAKRFTDSDKWKKAWFRKLSPKYKCFWIYLTDQCNHAGIWEVDFDLASMFIGEDINGVEVLELFPDHIQQINTTQWFIKDFIEFQYKCTIEQLNPSNKAHNSVISILNKYDIIEGLASPLQGDKDKDKDKDKELDKDKDKEKEKIPFSKIVEYLNEVSEKNYKHQSKATRSVIKARISEGFTVEDLKSVIFKKATEWKGTENDMYLRPETLFGAKKFEGYLNQAVPLKKTKEHPKSDMSYLDLLEG